MPPKIKHIEHIPENGFPEKGHYLCPYCGHLATLTPLAWTMEHCIYQCDNPKCKRTFYTKVNYKGSIVGVGSEPSIYNFDIIETYPKYVPKKHEAIPQNIWEDYEESCKDLDAGAFKSSVIMCRRMLQNVCLQRGATKRDANGKWIKLNDQIKFAFPQKDYSLIHAIADKIKYFGDYGAHPQDDNIDDVSQELAKKIVDFSNKILEIAYITPWELNKLST